MCGSKNIDNVCILQESSQIYRSPLKVFGACKEAGREVCEIQHFHRITTTQCIVIILYTYLQKNIALLKLREKTGGTI